MKHYRRFFSRFDKDADRLFFLSKLSEFATSYVKVAKRIDKEEIENLTNVESLFLYMLLLGQFQLADTIGIADEAKEILKEPLEKLHDLLYK